MAVGDLVAAIVSSMPPQANAAGPGAYVGGSTPAETFSVIRFPPFVDSNRDLSCIVNNYAGGDLEVTVPWFTDAAHTGEDIALRIGVQGLAQAHDMSGANSYNNTIQNATALAQPNLDYATIAIAAANFTIADGEVMRMRITRVGTDASDDLAVDALVKWQNIIIKEA